MESINRFAAVTVMALVIGGCLERYHFYRPSHDKFTSPTELGLVYEDIVFASSDGTRLHGWLLFARGEPRNTKGTVIHFHGNTRNISHHIQYVKWLPPHGFNVFLFDYRGYGESNGHPEPKGLEADGVAAIEYLRSRADLDSSRLVVFGQSLGGTYALSSLSKAGIRGVRAVVVEGAFPSHRAIAREKIEPYWMPDWMKDFIIQIFIGTDGDAATAVQQLEIPLLVIHGTDDRVVPIEHAERLCRMALGPKCLWRVPSGRHLDTFIERNEYRQQLVTYLENQLIGNEQKPSNCD